MDSRINTHRPPPNFSFLRSDPLSFSFVRQKVSWADMPKDSTCPASLRQSDTFHVSDEGRRSPLSIPHTPYRGHTPTYRFLPFSISLIPSRAWRGCNLYSVVFETGTYMRIFVAEDRMCAHTFPCGCYIYMYMYVCVTSIAFVLVSYRVEQRRWDPTSDRWYNWTGRTIPVSSLGLHSWNLFVSTHHSRLYY